MKDTAGLENVFLVGTADHNVRQLTREGGTGPSWVGDDKLLFAHGDAVCQIGVDGLGLAKVAEVSGSTVFRPSLSPRGNTILFSSRTYGGRASYSCTCSIQRTARRGHWSRRTYCSTGASGSPKRYGRPLATKSLFSRTGAASTRFL